jgi:uncharacterized protein (DUF983 family)
MKGKCPKCGASYYGWALSNPIHQKCEECGSYLEIHDARDCIEVLNSFFLYPKYKITFNKTKERVMSN